MIYLTFGSIIGSIVLWLQRRNSYHHVIFSVATLITLLIYFDMYFQQDFVLRKYYPFIMPFLVLQGPSLFLIDNSGVTQKKALAHYFTAAILLLDCVLYALLNTGISYSFSQSVIPPEKISYFFSPVFILVLHPLYSITYALLIFRRNRKGGAQLLAKKQWTPIALIFLSAVTFRTNLELLFEQTHTNNLSLLLLLLLSLLTLVLSINLISKAFIKPYTEATIKESMPETESSSLLSRIEEYVLGLEQSNSGELLSDDVTKIDFIKASPFSLDEWEEYFKTTGSGYVDLKKRVRISVALTLIENGFLNTFSVDALSREIGYKSRTSFYSAFEEITGSKFTEFREVLKAQNQNQSK